MTTAAVQQQIDVFNRTSSYCKQSAPTIGTNEKLQKRRVHTTLNFFQDNEDGSAPSPTIVGKPETYERPVAKHNVVIHDVTGDENQYTLDSHGFQFVPHISKEREFLNDAQIKDVYYKEVDQLLKNTTGATRTLIFDHTIRRAPRDQRVDTNKDEKEDEKAKAIQRGPVKRVHIDQSYDAALSRVSFHLPSEADKLLRGRVQLINVWRPIKTIKRDPLTVAQAQTVVEDDLVPVGLIYETRRGETYSVRHSDRHKWFYKHHQTPGEVLLIKCFDNKAGAGSAEKYGDRAKRVPHSAFEIPGTEEEDGRESIEVRCLVFHEDDIE